jgi:hypothetical protein
MISKLDEIPISLICGVVSVVILTVIFPIQIEVATQLGGPPEPGTSEITISNRTSETEEMNGTLSGLDEEQDIPPEEGTSTITISNRTSELGEGIEP